MLYFTHANRNQDDRAGVPLHRRSILSAVPVAGRAGALLALGLSFLFPSHAFAAIAFVSSASSFNLVAANTASTTVSGCTNTNPGFMIATWSTSGAAEPTSVTDNGVAIKEAMTHVFTQNGTYRGSIWYGAGATTTSHYFRATFADSTHMNDIFAACYTGVDQSTIIEATSSANYNGTAAGTALTTTFTTTIANDWAVEVGQANTQAPAGGTNNTIRQSDNNQGDSFGDSNSAYATPGSNTMQITSTASAHLDMLAIPFKPFIASAAPAQITSLLGVIWWF